MDKFVIRGGNPIKGRVNVDGAKNAAVAILPAALLAEYPVEINNLPYIDDVFTLEKILKQMGAKAEFSTDCKMVLDPTGVNTWEVVDDLVSNMRASYYLLGALLTKFGKAKVALPGGCTIGQRPIDLHIKGMESLGAKVEVKYGVITAEAPNGLKGTEIYLDVVSVGATVNIMLAAVKAEGNTVIVNAAKEPHIVDLANFLNMMGAKIKGAGTDTIRIKGVKSLSSCSYTVIPDQIETGTLMIAAAATRGDLIINNAIAPHMEALSSKLIETGAYVEAGDDYIRVSADKRLKKTNIKTLPYPGFPTDLQQPMTTLLSTAIGTSTIIENIYEDRFKHASELRRMGANIMTEGRVMIVEGVECLYGANVSATDLRAGAALIIAGLMADGVTTISNIKYIDRGYNCYENKLSTIGADIKRISFSE